MPDPPRLAVVASHPIQYQAPLWRALAADGRVEPHLLFLSRHGVENRVDPDFGASFAWDVDLLSGYRSRFLSNVREGAEPGRALSYVNPGIGRALSDIDPSAVMLLGMRNTTACMAFAWSRRRGIRTLYRAESSILHRRPLRSIALGAAALRAFDGVVTIGTANDLYYHAVGVPRERRFLAPYTVDNAYFSARRVSREAARAELGIDGEQPIVLYVGKLVPWKDPWVFLEGCARIAGEAPIRLLVAGDGPERTALEARARSLSVPLTVLGFMNQSRLSLAYSASDVLVLPSRDEPWGIVVNEAMCHGLPVLVSTQVGARLDLVRPGLNGEVFEVGDPSELEEGLRSLIESPERRARYGASSEEIISRWDVHQTVQGVVQAATGQ